MEQSDPFPQDLAVIGFDNTAAAKLITPWLVTVRQPMADKEPMVSRAFPSAK
jgi:DNA-binding LacI/PurR family transcriptional regulator